MGIIDLFFLPVAVIFAIVALNQKQNRKSDIFSILSFVFCIVPPIASIYDINARIIENDIVGVMDIYPTMANTYITTFLIVLTINVVRVFKKHNC